MNKDNFFQSNPFNLSTMEMEFHERIRAPLNKVWNIFYNKNGWDPWFTDGMKINEDGDIYFRWFRLTDGEVVTDTGKIVSVIRERLFSFWWYEYEDGFRSFVEMTFYPTGDNETIVTIKDRTLIRDVSELHIRYGCAYGWGQMMLLAKLYIEKNIIAI